MEATYAAVKRMDAAIHSLNDEFGAVNVEKTKQKIDPDKANQAMVRLRLALPTLQEESKKLLMELR